MAARLGNILYWLGIILGAIALWEALLDAFSASPSGSNNGLLMGVIICGVGWLAQHILREAR